MKTTVTMEVKVPVPGVAYSNISTAITLESDSEEHEAIVKKAKKAIGFQIQELYDEVKRSLEYAKKGD